MRFNGAITLNAIIDSGAADVSVPADIVSTLIRTKTVSEEDFLGVQTYVLADGTEVPSPRFRIRSLKVGNKTLENVTAHIASGNADILLGQSFLSRFKSWSVDNDRHVLILRWDCRSGGRDCHGHPPFKRGYGSTTVGTRNGGDVIRMAFPPEWHTLGREAELAAEQLAIGVTALGRANHTQKGLYHQAFFALSIGFERLAKLILVAEYAVENNGEWMTDQTLKSIGHDISALLDACDPISAKHLSDKNWSERPNDPVHGLSSERFPSLLD